MQFLHYFHQYFCYTSASNASVDGSIAWLSRNHSCQTSCSVDISTWTKNTSFSNVHQFAFNALWNSIVLSQKEKMERNWSLSNLLLVVCHHDRWWAAVWSGRNREWCTLSLLGILLFAHLGNSTSMWAASLVWSADTTADQTHNWPQA